MGSDQIASCKASAPPPIQAHSWAVWKEGYINCTLRKDAENAQSQSNLRFATLNKTTLTHMPSSEKQTCAQNLQSRSISLQEKSPHFSKMSRTSSTTSLESLDSQMEMPSKSSTTTNKSRPDLSRSILSSLSSSFQRKKSEPFVLDCITGCSDSLLLFRGIEGAGDSEARRQ